MYICHIWASTMQIPQFNLDTWFQIWVTEHRTWKLSISSSGFKFNKTSIVMDITMQEVQII